MTSYNRLATSQPVMLTSRFHCCVYSGEADIEPSEHGAGDSRHVTDGTFDYVLLEDWLFTPKGNHLGHPNNINNQNILAKYTTETS